MKTKKSKCVTVHLTPSQYDYLKFSAHIGGKTPSAFLRDVIECSSKADPVWYFEQINRFVADSFGYPEDSFPEDSFPEDGLN